jgi:hypothetical protein
MGWKLNELAAAEYTEKIIARVKDEFEISLDAAEVQTAVTELAASGGDRDVHGQNEGEEITLFNSDPNSSRLCIMAVKSPVLVISY